MTIKEKIDAVNKILLDGENINVSHDKIGGYTGYKPQYIVKAMNQIFGYGEWGFKELKMETTETIATCHLSVFIKGIECEMSAWGQSRITRGDIGDAMKGSQTDALKKALSYYDIGERAYFGLLVVPDKKTESESKTFVVKATKNAKCLDCGNNVSHKEPWMTLCVPCYGKNGNKKLANLPAQATVKPVLDEEPPLPPHEY